MKKNRPIRKNEEGVTAIEFAMIAPVLLLLTMGVIEVSLVMLAQNLLESATFAASRTGKTGYTAVGSSREDTIRNMVTDRAGVLLDSARIAIASESYSGFDKIDQPEPFIDANGNGKRDNGENYTDVNGNGQYDVDQGSAGAGNAGQVTVYTVTYPWHISTPIVSRFFAADGIVNLTARTVVQNEPY